MFCLLLLRQIKFASPSVQFRQLTDCGCPFDSEMLRPFAFVITYCLGNFRQAYAVDSDTDLTLPVINARFEFAEKDNSEQMKAFANAQSFAARVQHVWHNVQKDEQVLAYFEDIASARLDRMEVGSFLKKRSLVQE